MESKDYIKIITFNLINIKVALRLRVIDLSYFVHQKKEKYISFHFVKSILWTFWQVKSIDEDHKKMSIVCVNAILRSRRNLSFYSTEKKRGLLLNCWFVYLNYRKVSTFFIELKSYKRSDRNSKGKESGEIVFHQIWFISICHYLHKYQSILELNFFSVCYLAKKAEEKNVKKESFLQIVNPKKSEKFVVKVFLVSPEKKTFLRNFRFSFFSFFSLKLLQKS